METIKHIKLLEGYEIKLFDNPFSYEFISPEGEVIFQGQDFKPSPCFAIDSLDSVFTLLSFLTLRKRDTDKEYFEDYTEKQLEFRDNQAEYLSIYNIFEEGYLLTFFEIEEGETFLVYWFDETLEETEIYSKAFREIIEMGIDSHLEAFTESNFEEERNNRLYLKFSLKDSDILIRRLKEKGYKEIAKEIEGVLK